MKKKKIAVCHAQVPFVRGGAELLVEELYKQLKLKQFDVDLIQLPFKWYPKEELLNHTFAWRMFDLTESNGEEIDMVIATKFPSYGIKHPNKVTWLTHQFRQVYDLFNTSNSEFTMDPTDLAIKDAIKRFDQVTLKESKKIFTISQNNSNRLKHYNNIEAPALYHPPKHVGSYYSETYGQYILSIGRLDRLKRLDLLIESLRRTPKEIKCLIGGKGPEEESLKKLVKKYDLEDRITFLGFVDDKTLLELYANCFAVYFAPVDEDYGYITLEAFLSKKPILTANDSGGVLEFVKDNVNGYIVSPSSNEMADKIKSLYQNKKTCQEFGEIGYNDVKGYTWDLVIEKLTQ